MRLVSGTKILSRTLRNDFDLFHDQPAALQAAQTWMSDYREIKRTANNSRPIRASDRLCAHKDLHACLKQSLATRFEGPTIVVTHHCLHPGLVGAESQNSRPPAPQIFFYSLRNISLPIGSIATHTIA
jgi:hypothetical protein